MTASLPYALVLTRLKCARQRGAGQSNGLPWQREFPDNTAKDVEDGEEGTRGRCGGRV